MSAHPTAKQKARSRTKRPLVRIYQNFYADEQRAQLDPDFVPNDGRRNANTHYREVGLFARMYHSGRHLGAQYTGIVSPKFGEKTRRRGAEFIRFIENNPGYDVYFINPFPEHTYYCFNVWSHAEIYHPGLTALAQRLFRAAGLELDLAGMGRNSPATTLYSNFWAGNERFWDRFMDMNLKLLHALDHMTDRERRPYFENDASYHKPVPFVAFIFERLFSTFLLMEPTIGALGWPYSGDDLLAACDGSAETFPIVASFRDSVDGIDARGKYDSDEKTLFAALSRLVAKEATPRRIANLG